MISKLPIRTKLSYGSADLGFSITSTILGAFFAIYLTDVVGISPGISAIAIFFGRSWDYINDPMIGYFSDRTRSKWGRRRPYLLFGALPFALTFTMLWWKPPGAGGALLAIYYAVAYILFDTANTFLFMPYLSLTPELTDSYDERTSLTSYRMFFSIAGSLVSFTLPLIIIGKFRPENASKALLMGGIFGLVSAAPMLLAFFGTKEREEFMHQEQPKLFKSLKSVMKNKVFVFGLGLFLFTWLSIDIVQTTLIYFLKYGVKRESQSDLILATIFITAIIALPLWRWLSGKWGKRKAFIFGIAFWASVQVVIVLLSPSTPLYLLLVFCVLAGIGVAAAHVLPWAILPDAIEWEEWQTGKRHEGVYYSLITLIRKITVSIAIPLTLLLLEVSGYEANAVNQSSNAVLVIRILTGPVPAILLCIAILFAVYYPLDQKKHQEIVLELEKRRGTKPAFYD